jgi:hypothetical protein
MLSHGFLYWGLYYRSNSKFGGQEKIKDILVAITAKAQKKELLVSGVIWISKFGLAAVGLLQHISLFSYLAS